MDLGICVWNLDGFVFPFRPQFKSRHTTEGDFKSRVEATSAALGQLVASHRIGLFVLPEIGSAANLEALREPLGKNFEAYRIGQAGEMNIGVLYRSDLLGIEPRQMRGAPICEDGSSMSGRPFAGLLTVVTKANGKEFDLAACHWPSGTTGPDKGLRADVALWLREELEKRGCIHRPLIIAGDFNAEPYELCFSPGYLFGRRHASSVLRGDRGSLRLFNPMWRFLVDSKLVEEHRLHSEFTENQRFYDPYPLGTIPATSRVVDGFLLSHHWLGEARTAFREESIRILTDPLWHKQGEQGVHYSRRFDAKQDRQGISDHLPVVVQLSIT